ncbi:ABC transporter permease subunit [Paenibacillus qinlingensis]|uniref:Aldouronate transport system permease protein n=1 Tax=Paenibacillus qinlingensis TaxID=1837343 RepID=A0ABU1NSX7_9BACL|nr:ABC transporter permease subunit [Paenibacillus qinlingensis]MDR6550587.1 putative aldouronate transport system permease protein [Paenibacillus qinlingensis]
MKLVFRTIVRDRVLYIMMFPGLLFYLIFRYVPMYGLLMAFQNYSISKGVWGSKWVGFEHFRAFFDSPDAAVLIRNTLVLNALELLVVFPAPILLAVLFHELRFALFKRLAQTISYLPHFISTVVICGIIVNFLSPSTGIVNHLLQALGIKPIMFLGESQWFRPIYIASELWQKAGWDTIIYLAAIAGVNPTLYEAAKIDGANRWQQIRHVTLVGMIPVMIILFIIKIGHILELGVQKIILLYNPLVYDKADVISTFVYRRGLLDADYSFASAVSLFQSVIGLILVIAFNRLARKYSETSLW